MAQADSRGLWTKNLLQLRVAGLAAAALLRLETEVVVVVVVVVPV
jgi:hypothetical protein